MAYAGRLDPMAQGKMLILAGEACKEREKYLSLDKEYLFEILLGFSSDSGDILGVAKKGEEVPFFNHREVGNLKERVEKVLNNMTGRRKMKYPVYSSKPVRGRPLFLWALEKKLDEIEIPEKEIEIYKIELLKIKGKKVGPLKKELFKKIKSLKEVKEESKKLGEDFRRKDVLES